MKTLTGRHQRGGTMLGLVIGALIGLGAALAVAVYVTKVPVPFLNKNPQYSAEGDAAEAKKNKDWNPNAPLAGKNPARTAPAAAGTVTTAPLATEVPPPVAAASAASSAKAAAAANKPAVSADPLGDLAKARAQAARPEVKPPAAPSLSGTTADPFNYFIQAGAFRTPEDAEQQRAKLTLLGFQAKVSEREQAGRTVYRVRLGPFDKKDDADRAKEKLESNAVETALVRVQR